MPAEYPHRLEAGSKMGVVATTLMIGGIFVKANRLMILFAIFSVLLTGCSEPSYHVTGTVVDKNGNGISNVTLVFSDSFGVAKTDGDGKWSKSGLRGVVTITPQKAGWSFAPKQVAKAEENVNFSRVKRTYEYGDPVSYDVDGVDFKMRLAPAATFPIGVDDRQEVTVASIFGLQRPQ